MDIKTGGIITNRYSKILKKNCREIVLLKGFPCKWGRCSFCDYIIDNDTNEESIIKINKAVLSNVTGEFEKLEVINSGSVFELPEETLCDIENIVKAKNIKFLYFESHWSYKDRLGEIIKRFSFGHDFKKVKVSFKLGLETFDDDFRNDFLRKGIYFDSIDSVANKFDSVCLMVGIKGQTKEMVDRDIELFKKNFQRGCINIFVKNTTEIEEDNELADWFREKYHYLEENNNIEILWNISDFGIG